MNTPETSDMEVRTPEWHKWANIYEVNLRQYTPEGTLAAFRAHLPRLRDMGVDILWFMPVHPISKARRKGNLGSPYAVADYGAVNPDFGTLEEFRSLVAQIHELGMHAIIDWVPNHTGWDHPWISEHPDWYTRGSDGEITAPINPMTGDPWGWDDVADLDYSNPGMRQAMIDNMVFWVRETAIDGFRVDVAHGIPHDFWEQLSRELYTLKPLFMLAESEIPALLNKGYFTMDYGWEMQKVLNRLARSQGLAEGGAELDRGNVVKPTGDNQAGTIDALAIDRQLALQDSRYRRGYKMYFTSNHDENSWAGTEFDRLGPAHQTFAVLTGTFDGMPLVYSGQESAMDRRLAFFEKDTIPWGDFAYSRFYMTLNELKHRNRALWNGRAGGRLEKIRTGRDEEVYAFTRERDGDRVVVVLNLSNEAQDVKLHGNAHTGDYTDVFSGESVSLMADMPIRMDAWGYRVYSNK